MHKSFAAQYRKPCVVIPDGDTLPPLEDFIAFANEIGARYEEVPGSVCYVVQFPGRPQELYTESAIQRTWEKAPR